MTSNWFSDNFFINNSIATLFFFVAMIFFRLAITKMIRSINKPWTSEQRLRTIGYIRSVFFGMLVVGFLYIWGEQVHNLAVSLFAIALAVVISVKELFMCINGTVLRFRGNLYSLGDRVEINGVRGDVIDMNLLSTTLLEAGPDSKSHHHTGRVVSFPNSTLMSKVVINESFIDHFYFHNIKIPMNLEEDWQKAHEVLLAIAKEECTPYLELARRRMIEMAKQKSIVLPSVEPRIILQMPAPKKVNLVLRFPGPVHLKGRLEQTILRKFLERFFARHPEVHKE